MADVPQVPEGASYDNVPLSEIAALIRDADGAVERIVEGKGLFRCHRSYLLNPEHVKALSKGKEGMIEAEMDVDCTPIPVSKRYYDSLASQF